MTTTGRPPPGAGPCGVKSHAGTASGCSGGAPAWASRRWRARARRGGRARPGAGARAGSSRGRGRRRRSDIRLAQRRRRHAAPVARVGGTQGGVGAAVRPGTQRVEPRVAVTRHDRLRDGEDLTGFRHVVADAAQQAAQGEVETAIVRQSDGGHAPHPTAAYPAGVAPSPPAVDPPGDAPPLAGRRAWLVLAAMALPLVALSMDINGIGTVLPSIRTGLHTSFARANWVVSASTLAFAVALLPAGRWSARRGRRRIFLVGVVLLGVSGVVCGVTPGIYLLVAARAVQGLAARCASPPPSPSSTPPSPRSAGRPRWAPSAPSAAWGRRRAP